MEQARNTRIWHISRGRKQVCRISGQELRLLAELGHLKADDMLWKPGFGGWRAAHSIPGILIPPPLSLTPSMTVWKLTCARLLALKTACDRLSQKCSAQILPAARRFVRVRSRVTVFSKKRFRSLQLHAAVSRRLLMQIRFDLQAFLGGIEHPRGMTILLTAVLALGTFDVAIRASFATSPNHAALAAQHFSPAAVEASALIVLQPEAPKLRETTGARSEVAAGIADTLPSVNFVSEAELSSPPSQLEPYRAPAASQPQTIPLPTRKPLRAISKAVSAAAAKRVTTAKQEPRPMPFGVIGFNYSGQ
jgi:hypothetical protein